MIKVIRNGKEYTWDFGEDELWFIDLFKQHEIEELMSLAYSNPDYFEVLQ